jgi:hypothetical protein
MNLIDKNNPRVWNYYKSGAIFVEGQIIYYYCL